MDSIRDVNNEEESGIKRVILKGFEATGIYPFNILNNNFNILINNNGLFK